RVAALEELAKGLAAEVKRLGADMARGQPLREEVTAAQEVQRKLGAEVAAAEAERAAPAVTWRESDLMPGVDARDRLRATVSGGVGVALLLMLVVTWREVRRGRVYAA